MWRIDFSFQSPCGTLATSAATEVPPDPAAASAPRVPRAAGTATLAIKGACVLTVGDQFPEYELTACVSLDPDNAFETINHKSHQGKWRVVFF